MKTYLTLLFATVTATGVISCVTPGEEDDDDDDHAHTVTTENVAVDPYTGATHTETTTMVVRHD